MSKKIELSEQTKSAVAEGDKIRAELLKGSNKEDIAASEGDNLLPVKKANKKATVTSVTSKDKK